MAFIENVLSVAMFVLPQQIRVTEPAPAFKVINKVNRSVTCSMHNLVRINTVKSVAYRNRACIENVMYTI